MNPNEPEILITSSHDPMIHFLKRIVMYSVKVLALFIVFIILWGLVDLTISIYHQILSVEYTTFSTEIFLNILGSVLAILVAVSVFLNTIFYIQKNAVHVPSVLATALTAVARKVIIIDYNGTDYELIFGMAAIILAIGITYWLVTAKSDNTPIYK